MSLDRPADSKTREALIEWVEGFLWYWEDSGMQYNDAAEIIVNQILKELMPPILQGGNKNQLSRLQGYQSFFECQEG